MSLPPAWCLLPHTLLLRGQALYKCFHYDVDDNFFACQQSLQRKCGYCGWMDVTSGCHVSVVLSLFAVNLARFTKTRVCSSCFGSTNSGTRLFTKTQICSSCFGSTNLGHSASFQSSDGLFYLGCLLLFVSSPFILSFHCPCAPRLPCWGLSHCFGHDPSHSMHLAYEFGLTALASVSSFRPLQLGICCCRQTSQNF